MATLPAELAPPEPMPNRETVELFSYFLREFKGFMTHMDAALQVPPSWDIAGSARRRLSLGSAPRSCCERQMPGPPPHACLQLIAVIKGRGVSRQAAGRM